MRVAVRAGAARKRRTTQRVTLICSSRHWLRPAYSMLNYPAAIRRTFARKSPSALMRMRTANFAAVGPSSQRRSF